MYYHALRGCDTRSGFFGKRQSIDCKLTEQKKRLLDDAALYLIISHRQNLRLHELEKKLNLLSTRHLGQIHLWINLCSSRLTSRLPPTSAALEQHSYRAFQQIHLWCGADLKPIQWGWKTIINILLPILTTEPPAPISNLQLISCGCKKGCGKRCGCAKVELKCSTMCSDCREQGCLNSVIEKGFTEDIPINV